jgi:nicotinamide-nucleotide amidase
LRRPAVELVAIGDELLLGQTLDTNGAWMARRLAEEGIRVDRRTTVGDDPDAIMGAVKAALDRTGTVICTGGLGPTQDDVTKDAVASLVGRPLELDPDVLAAIEARFRRRGLAMAERNRRQADVPAGATVLENRQGTAPGLWLADDEDRVAILLPGVPHEARALFDDGVLPRLRERFPGPARRIVFRVVRTTGIAESALAERLADALEGMAPLRVAFLPSFEGTDVRLTAWSDLEDTALQDLFDAAEAVIRDRARGRVYATGDDTLAAVVGEALVRRGARLALAESCTGGMVASWLTDVPGASRFLVAGVVAYANEAKTALLGVDSAVLEAHGAVSEEAVRAMLHGARQANNAEAGLAVTGIAGPEGGTPEKPVGTVWIAAGLGERVEARLLHLGGSRDEVRRRSAQAALALLWRLLETELS